MKINLTKKAVQNPFNLASPWVMDGECPQNR